jgi:hypothetical protein
LQQEPGAPPVERIALTVKNLFVFSKGRFGGAELHLAASASFMIKNGRPSWLR